MTATTTNSFRTKLVNINPEYSHFPCTLPNFEECKGAFRLEPVVSHSHFRKLHLCTLVFLYLFLDGKKELNALLFHSKWLDWNLIRHNSQIWTRSPEPLQTMIEKNKIMILCSICTLVFVSGPVTCTCASSRAQIRTSPAGELNQTV